MAISPLDHRDRSFKLFLTLGPPTCGCRLSTVPSRRLPAVSTSSHASAMRICISVCKCITQDISNIIYSVVLVRNVHSL